MNTMDTPKPDRFPTARGFRRALFSRKMGLAVIVLFTLIALFYAVENYRGARAWAAYQKETAARGVKLDMAAFVPPEIPDAENGAMTPWIKSWFSKPRPAAADEPWPAFKAEAGNLISRRKADGQRHLTDLVAWQEALTFSATNITKRKGPKIIATQREPEVRAAAAVAVLDMLQPYEPTLNELRAASRMPSVRFPVEYKLDQPFSILLPHLEGVKGVVSLLDLRASAALAAGRTNQAFEDVQLMFWMTDSLKDEPFLINHLVRIACLQIVVRTIWEGLAQHRWSETQLAQLQERLLRTDFLSSHQLATDAERAAAVTTIEWARTHGGFQALTDFGEMEENSNPGANIVSRLAPRGWFRMEAVNVGRVIDLQTAGVMDVQSRTADTARLEANTAAVREQLQGGLSMIWKHRIFARLLVPSLETTSRRFAIAQTTATEAALACAIERHRLATGERPVHLEKLVPKFLARIPADPIDGGAFQYEPVGEDGFVLRSKGWPSAAGAEKGRPAPDRVQWIWNSEP